jgi:hypothetical protein
MNKSIWLLAVLLIAIVFVSGCTGSGNATLTRSSLAVKVTTCEGNYLDNTAKVEGTVNNNGTEDAHFVQVDVKLISVDGQIVGHDVTYVSGGDVPAGASIPFTAYVEASANYFQKCSASITSSE